MSELYLAMDPGNEESALVGFVPNSELCGGMQIISTRFLPNYKVREVLQTADYRGLVIETPRARGMPTSNEEMETLVWIGRFFDIAQRRGKKWGMVFRSDVKSLLCGTASATDANIRAAAIDHFGGESRAIGGKKCRECKGRKEVDGGMLPCQVCHSTGEVPGKSKPKKCPTCKGRKEVKADKVECDRCEGSGRESPVGPLKGFSAHSWQALGVAITWNRKKQFVQRILPAGSNVAQQALRKEKRDLKAAKEAAKAAKLNSQL